MTVQSEAGPSQIDDPRLTAICDLSVAAARQEAGLHRYDGVVQDLSPSGVAAGLRALSAATALPQDDPHDEAHLNAASSAMRARFAELEAHRTNPLWHILNLDVSSYDRDYAPAEQRQAARDQHVRQWPDAVDAAIDSLDQVPAPVAAAALPLAQGLGSFLTADEHISRDALKRLIAHLQHAADHGDPNGAMGSTRFRRLLESSEATTVDLDALAERAAVERTRLQNLLEESAGRLDPDAPVETTIDRLRSEHPTPETLLSATAAVVGEAIAWTAEQGLVPYLDGRCEVALMPESQRIAAAGMVGAAPHEPDAPSRFYVTPPDPTLPVAEQERWLASYFNRATLPVIAVHEVAPGHFAHSRSWRHATGQVRRTLFSDGFSEGWAHYCEELALEEGFRGDDPAFAAGVALDGLRRVARLYSAIGLHHGGMSLDEAAAVFSRYAYVRGSAAYSEARRGLLDPGYGCYTWGKFALLDLKERAKAEWQGSFSTVRFHRAMLELGSPPLGLLGTAIEQG